MNPVSASYQHRCCVCRRKQPEMGADLAWFHPVCAQVICSRCQFQDNKMKAVNANQPCPDSKCLYHQDKDKASMLCPWPSCHPHGSRIIAPALPMLISQDAISNLESKEGTDPPGRVDTPLDSINEHIGDADKADLETSKPFYELCGNCHKQGELHCIMSVDLECVIGMCVLCFGYPKGHDDHARDKLLRLTDREMIADPLMKMLTEVFTTDVVKRVDSAYCSDMAIKAVHKKGEGNSEEGKALEVVVKPIIQSFIQRMRQIQRCGDALLSMYNDLQHAYNEVRMMMRPGDNTSEPTSEPSDSSSPSADTESKSSPEDNKLVQFLLNEGKNAIEDILSRLEGMVAQRKMLSDTLDYVLMLLGLPSTTLSIGEKEQKEEGEQETIKVIQDAFKKIDISCSKHASKAILIVRTFKGIRGIIEGDDISFELDIDGLDGLGLKEGVKEIIISLQNIGKHFHSPQYDEEVERVKANVIEKCDTVSKMLTMEAVYSAMEQSFARNGPERHLNEGLDYMLAEGGKAYDGAKAMAAFDLAITLGNKEAIFRKAQLLITGRVGVKRDAALAVQLFEGLKNQGLYLPQSYYYLAKHALERSHGRTVQTYKLFTRYFRKIVSEVRDHVEGDDEDEGMEEDEDLDGREEDEDFAERAEEDEDFAERAEEDEDLEGREEDEDLEGKAEEDEELEEKEKDDKEDGEEEKAGDEAKTSGVDDDLSESVGNEGVSNSGGDTDSEDTKAAVLFAKAGMCYIYETVECELKPYFLKQVHPAIREWIMEHNLLDLCLQAKEAGCKEPELHSMLGFAYYLRDQDEEDGKAALAHLTKACSLGVSAAYHNMGIIYGPSSTEVTGCLKDPKKALSYYLQAEATGYNDGGRLFTDIGNIYCSSEYEEKDCNKALEYYSHAISHGDDCAYHLKASLYEHSPPGICGRTAHKLKRDAEAANCKHPFLFQSIAVDYTQGIGVKRDGLLAVKYYKKGIKYGGQRMYQFLGELYDSKRLIGIPNLKKNDSKALAYYLKEADMVEDDDGFDLDPVEPWLYEHLGSMYEEGRGTSIDYNKAIEYYKRAGKTSTYALTRLGVLHDTAHSEVPYLNKNDQTAREYYEAASDCGIHPTSGMMYTDLGNMYRDGRGGHIDGMIAVGYYDNAVNLGWYDALYEKAIIFDPEQKDCPPFEKDEQRATELYHTADAAGGKSEELMLALANCFEQGRYMEKGKARAGEFFLRSFK